MLGAKEKREFIDFILKNQVLQFGNFKLKSGRLSPYFFNLGAITGGAALERLGEFYALALDPMANGISGLFGPAYKGIPLVTATAIAHSRMFGSDLPIAYDRKEAKDHGEGGRLVGGPLQGRIAIIDDVLTVGTAVRGALRLIRGTGATPVALLVAIDREERGAGTKSALDELAEQEHIQVQALIGLSDLVSWLSENPSLRKEYNDVKEYRRLYGAAAG